MTPSPDLWPIPPPLWSWTACTRSGRRHRARRLRLRLRTQLLQLVVCALNWECLGHPRRAPANARCTAPVSAAQARVLERLENQVDYLLSAPAFASDHLGRSAPKFEAFANMLQELPSDHMMGVDLLSWASDLHASLLPYEHLSPLVRFLEELLVMGVQGRRLFPVRAETCVRRRSLSTFVPGALCPCRLIG